MYDACAVVRHPSIQLGIDDMALHERVQTLLRVVFRNVHMAHRQKPSHKTFMCDLLLMAPRPLTDCHSFSRVLGLRLVGEQSRASRLQEMRTRPP